MFPQIIWGSMLLMTMSTAVITVLHSAEVVHVTHESWFSSDRRILVVPGNHYKTVQWFHLDCNVPTEVSLPAWASHPPRSPLLCLMGPAIAASPTPSHGSAITTSLNIQVVCHHSFPAQPVGTPRLDSTTYYARPYPCRLMVVLFSWVVAPWTGP
jgi:hypothetical protein